MSKPKIDPLLERFRRQLQEAGLRRTPSRLAVLRRLSIAKSPMTHAELTDALVGQGYDQTTIYRNLTDLTEAKLVARLDLGDHVWRFELRQKHDTVEGQQHPHFVCDDCGTVTCLPDVKVAISPSPGSKSSGISQVREVLIKGTCGECK